MLTVTGYTDRWVFGSEEKVEVHLSSTRPRVYWWLLRHLGAIHVPSDWISNTAAVEEASGVLDGVGSHSIAAGSFFSAPLDLPEGAPWLRLKCNILPTRLFDAAVIARIEFGDFWIALRADAAGSLSVENSVGQNKTVVSQALIESTWQTIEFEIERYSMMVRVKVRARGNERRNEVKLLSVAPAKATALHVAGDGVQGCFDGKIESPELYTSSADGIDWQLAARWNFADYACGPFRVPETAANGAVGRLRNAPTRAVTSSGFDGRNCDFTKTERGYDAVWFHVDDLGDAQWPVALSIKLPKLATGVYSIVVTTEEQLDWADRESFDALPIFVWPELPSASRVALVLPTFSYRAYANNTFAEAADPRIFQLKRESRSKPLYDTAIAMNLHSLYSLHADGSGVALASLKRPQLTIRADFDSQLQGFAHQFSADLEIVGWLEALGVSYDILTDEVLHEDGAQALSRYKVVISGSHPEYSSAKLLDAYDDYLGSGGSMMYLGGNGFYWSVALSSSAPEFIEVRRSEGTRTWTAGVGERRHQLDGTDGGIWRSLGRPPNAAFGVGFSAHGFSGDGTYAANPNARIPDQFKRTRQFFSSIGSASFGIAGLELDRFAPEFGSPSDTVVLASVDKMPSGYLPTVEELGGLDELIPDAYGALARMVRGDIVIKPNRDGGHVFSAGSIRWVSGLSDPEDAFRVRSLTTAVLLDLLDE